MSVTPALHQSYWMVNCGIQVSYWPTDLGVTVTLCDHDPGLVTAKILRLYEYSVYIFAKLKIFNSVNEFNGIVFAASKFIVTSHVPSPLEAGSVIVILDSGKFTTSAWKVNFCSGQALITVVAEANATKQRQMYALNNMLVLLGNLQFQQLLKFHSYCYFYFLCGFIFNLTHESCIALSAVSLPLGFMPSIAFSPPMCKCIRHASLD